MPWNICWNAKDNFHLELWTRFFRTLSWQLHSTLPLPLYQNTLWQIFNLTPKSLNIFQKENVSFSPFYPSLIGHQNISTPYYLDIEIFLPLFYRTSSRNFRQEISFWHSVLKYEEKEFFCHQKQYNFGASRLREKELTKEKMSYVSWHANILELHQACLKHSTGTTRHYYAQMIGFHSLFKKNKGRRRGKNLQRKKVERSASDFLFCFPVKEQKNEEITWPFS